MLGQTWSCSGVAEGDPGCWLRVTQKQLRSVLFPLSHEILDSELFELMHQNGDYTHFYFCYRWFLLDFKRGKKWVGLHIRAHAVHLSSVRLPRHVCAHLLVRLLHTAVLLALSQAMVFGALSKLQLPKH